MPYLNNLEQAITNVLEANLRISWTSVLNAYYKITNSKASVNMSFQVVIAFERAMGKYPAAGESSSSLFAHHVASIRKEYYEFRLTEMGKILNIRILRPCGCCYETFEDRFRDDMGFMDGELKHQVPCPRYEPEHFSKPKTSKQHITKRINSNSGKKVTGKRVIYDIYAPSTSARSM